MTAIFVLMLTVLSLNVSLRRAKLKVLIGDGDDTTLRRRIRAHGNFVENAPLCILLVLAIEAILATSGIIWIVAAILIASRLLHAIGTLGQSTRFIVPAMVMQHATLVICGLWLLIQSLGNLSAAGM
ncbi:MAPEG family protein [Thalassospira indica]|nr:MAPEG family protein [Thalassospira indica]